MKKIWMAVMATVLTGMAQADIVRVPASQSVAATMDALETAVAGAGATVFARIDHGGGAQSIGASLAPWELLVFGHPRLGTPAMQDAAEAGLALPLRVLVYEDAEGQVWLAYEDPTAMLTAFDGIAADAPYLATMTGALSKLTGVAAGQ